MSRANPLWGAPRIHGELRKLGVEISQATVSKYLVRHPRPPSQTWRTFLENHVGSLVSVDFFVIPTVMFKVLFVFVVLAHERDASSTSTSLTPPPPSGPLSNLWKPSPGTLPLDISCATAAGSTASSSRVE
jgi:hypothetical protein